MCKERVQGLLSRWLALCVRVIIFCFIPFIVGGFFRLDAVAVETPGELFKKFIENPPTIKNLVYAQEIPGLATNYCRLKWQDGALWFGTSKTNLFEIANLDNTGVYSLIVARFAEKMYCYNGTDLYSWTNHDYLDTNFNSVRATFDQVVSGQLADILNMGCQLASVASIKWQGNQFEVENPFKKTWARGNLDLDPVGRASKLHVEHGPLRTGKATRDNPPWDYEYFYENGSHSGYLPKMIVASFKKKDGSVGMSLRYTIGTIEIATEEIPEAEFSLLPSQFSRLEHVVTVSEGNLIFEDQGKLVITKERTPTAPYIPLLKRSKLFLAIAVLMILSPLFFFWLCQRKKTKNKQ